MDLNNKHGKLESYGYDSKLEIMVQKIKVKKSVFNSYLAQIKMILIVSSIILSIFLDRPQTTIV